MRRFQFLDKEFFELSQRVAGVEIARISADINAFRNDAALQGKLQAVFGVEHKLEQFRGCLFLRRLLRHHHTIGPEGVGVLHAGFSHRQWRQVKLQIRCVVRDNRRHPGTSLQQPHLPTEEEGLQIGVAVGAGRRRLRCLVSQDNIGQVLGGGQTGFTGYQRVAVFGPAAQIAVTTNGADPGIPPVVTRPQAHTIDGRRVVDRFGSFAHISPGGGCGQPLFGEEIAAIEEAARVEEVGHPPELPVDAHGVNARFPEVTQQFSAHQLIQRRQLFRRLEFQ